MNISDYAKRYRKGDVRAVKKYLSQGRIRGAILANNEWEIPDGAKIKYRPRFRKSNTCKDNVVDILKALDGNWYIDASILYLSEEDYLDRVVLLHKMGFIVDSTRPFDGVTSTGLSLTPQGLEASAHNKKQLLAIFDATVTSLSEGVTRALTA